MCGRSGEPEALSSLTSSLPALATTSDDILSARIDHLHLPDCAVCFAAFWLLVDNMLSIISRFSGPFSLLASRFQFSISFRSP